MEPERAPVATLIVFIMGPADFQAAWSADGVFVFRPCGFDCPAEINLDLGTILTNMQ
jgi:hypothetical protein